MGSQCKIVAEGGPFVELRRLYLIVRTFFRMGKSVLKAVQKSPLLLYNTKLEILNREKALRLCVKKLEKISDPESNLCQAVLINNTLKSLHTRKEIKLESFHKKELDAKVIDDKNPTSDSLEDILCEIVLPPLIPQLEHLLSRTFKDWSEPASERIGEMLYEERIVPAREAEAFADHGDEEFKTEMFSRRTMGKRENEDYSSNSKTKFANVASSDVTLEELLEELD